MTEHKDEQVFYGGMSPGNFATASFSNHIALFGGLYSCTNGYTPTRTLNVGSASATDVAKFAMTLAYDLFGPKR